MRQVWLAALLACALPLVLVGCRREAPPEAPASDVAQRVYRVGDPVRFPQAVVTLVEAKREGQRLTLRLRVEATRDVSVRQQYDFELKDTAGHFGTPALLGVPEPPLDGRVAAGERLEGYLGFDLTPQMTDPAAMQLGYRPTFAPDVTVTFTLG